LPKKFNYDESSSSLGHSHNRVVFRAKNSKEQYCKTYQPHNRSKNVDGLQYHGEINASRCNYPRREERIAYAVEKIYREGYKRQSELTGVPLPKHY
jgi:hypothetical protein